MKQNKKAQLAVALDVDTLQAVRKLVDALDDCVDIYKVGSQLFTACGPVAVRFIQARGKKVFLDLKYHDIPNTVASAVKVAVGLNTAIERSMENPFTKDPHVPNIVQPLAKAGKPTSLFMYTLHTSGGLEMMKAAVEAGQKAAAEIGAIKPLAVGVTVLTSEAKTEQTLAKVLERALLAKTAGLDGVVASCEEAAFLRKEFGKDFVIVTPGIRPAGGDKQDQQRVATPAGAIKSGSDFLVVGRPIVQAPDPRKAARMILEEMEGA